MTTVSLYYEVASRKEMSAKDDEIKAVAEMYDAEWASDGGDYKARVIELQVSDENVDALLAELRDLGCTTEIKSDMDTNETPDN